MANVEPTMIASPGDVGAQPQIAIPPNTGLRDPPVAHPTGAVGQVQVTPKGHGTGAESIRLTPYLSSPMVTISPWMIPAEGFRMSPMAQMSLPVQGMNGTAPVRNMVYTHLSESNKFENSFARAVKTNSPPQGQPIFTVTTRRGSSTTGQVEASAADVLLSAAAAVKPARSSGRVTAGNTAKSAAPKRKAAAGAGNAAAKTTAKARVKARSPSPSPSPEPCKRRRSTVSVELRKQKRRAQNRRNAAKCRQRKIDKVNELSGLLEELRQENLRLKASHLELENKLATYEARA